MFAELEFGDLMLVDFEVVESNTILEVGMIVKVNIVI